MRWYIKTAATGHVVKNCSKYRPITINNSVTVISVKTRDIVALTNTAVFMVNGERVT